MVRITLELDFLDAEEVFKSWIGEYLNMIILEKRCISWEAEEE